MADVIAWDADGRRVGLTPLARVAGYATSLADQPTNADLDALAVARQAMRRRQMDGHTASDLRVCTNPACVRCGEVTDEMMQRAAETTGPALRLRVVGDE